MNDNNTIDLTKLRVEQMNPDGTISSTNMNSSEIINPTQMGGGGSGGGASTTAANADVRPIVPYKAYVTSMVRMLQSILAKAAQRGIDGLRDCYFSGVSSLEPKWQSAVVAFALRDIIRYAQLPSTVLPNPITIQSGFRKLMRDEMSEKSDDDYENLEVPYHYVLLNNEEIIDVLYYAYVEFYQFDRQSIGWWRYYDHVPNQKNAKPRAPITEEKSFEKWLGENFKPDHANYIDMKYAYKQLMANVIVHYDPGTDSIRFTTVTQNRYILAECIYCQLKDTSIPMQHEWPKNVEPSMIKFQKLSNTEKAAYICQDINRLITFTHQVLGHMHLNRRALNTYILMSERENLKTKKPAGVTMLIEFVGADQLITLDMLYHLSETDYFDEKLAVVRKAKWKSTHPEMRYKLGVLNNRKSEEDTTATAITDTAPTTMPATVENITKRMEETADVRKEMHLM